MRAALWGLAACLQLCVVQRVSVAQAADASAAIAESSITKAGSVPFHLKAAVSQPGNKNSQHKAEIEEYWVRPDKWRRQIKSRDFSQTLIVNGAAVSEQHTGEYYPMWLRNSVTALFDLPAASFSKPSEAAKKPEDLLSVPMSQGTDVPGGLGSHCRHWESTVGVLPAQNKLVNNVCMFGDPQIVTMIDIPGFHAHFRIYREFKGELAPRVVLLDLAPKTQIEVQVNDLTELRHEDESLFQINSSSPGKDTGLSVRIEEPEARKMLLNSADIAWMPVREGKPSGVLSILLYVDKEGRVRETIPLNSDNLVVQDQARKEVSQWRFRPLQRADVAVQMEVLMTLPFQTTIVNPIPLLSNGEARQIAVFKSEPKFTSSNVPKGTAFTVRITVDEQGNVVRTENIHHDNEALYSLAAEIVASWRFKPYKVEGKPDRFNADIVFHVQ